MKVEKENEKTLVKVYLRNSGYNKHKYSYHL